MPVARISTIQSFAFKLCPPVLDAGLYALKSEKLKWRKMLVRQVNEAQRVGTVLKGWLLQNPDYTNLTIGQPILS